MLRNALQFTAITLVLIGPAAYSQTDVPATDKAATSTPQANQDARAEKPAATSPAKAVSAEGDAGKAAAEKAAAEKDAPKNNEASQGAPTGSEPAKASNPPASADGKADAAPAGEDTGKAKAGDANPAATKTGATDDGKAPAGMQEAKTPQAPAQPDGAATPQGSTGTSVPAASGDDKKVSTEALEPKKSIWAFGGMRGTLDKQSAQRGFQIYSQVCSVCHSMNLVSYRDLARLGFSEGEIKKIASDKQVADMSDNGEPVQRPAKPFDHFVPPYPNEKASRAANNGAYPPDLSLIIKAREEGPDYVHSLLTGFGNPPANEPPVSGKYYNPYFQGHWISMPPPLRDGAVTYQDGTTASVDQMASDVVTFLQWAAEPEMQDRHEMGLKVLAFLIVMAGFFYVAKKRVWKNLKH